MSSLLQLAVQAMGCALFWNSAETAQLQRIPDAGLVLGVWDAWQDCLKAAARSRRPLGGGSALEPCREVAGSEEVRLATPPEMLAQQHHVLAAFAVAFWQPQLLRLAYPAAIPAGFSSLELVSRRLQHLEITAPVVQRLDMVAAACPQLLCLGLRGCSSLGDASLAALSRLAHLRALDLDGLVSLSDGACYHIAKVPSLAALNLSHTSVTDKGIELLTYGHKVRAWQRAAGGASLPPEVAVGWPPLPLEHLQLAGTKVGVEGVAELARLPHIRFLDMRHTGIGRAALAPLQRRFALQFVQAAVLSSSNTVAAAVLNHDVVLCRCGQGSGANNGQAGVHLVGLRSKYSSALDMPPHDQQRASPATDVDVRARAFATGAPTTLPALAPRPLPRAVMCPLSSLNDPDNYGLGVNPQGSGEPIYYWQQLHSMSNPREVVASSGCRTGSPSTLPCQGFRTAQTRSTMQRVVFRSSMLDPEAAR
ncbi:hypothetical protein ACK3TF_003911 [Chlorella vulgaris]